MHQNIPKLKKAFDTKLKSCGRKGIPESMRYLIWPRLAEVEELKKTHEFYYEQYLEVEEYEQKESIQKD